MIMKRIARTFALSAAGLVILGLAAPASAADTTCSNATIKGAFARTDNGYVIAVNGQTSPLAGLSLQTFDGKGRWTATGFASLNGIQFPMSTSQGTYTVNPDCTGHYEPDFAPPGRTGGAFLIVIDGGSQIQILPTDQGAVLTCVARRVSAVGN
jgi:hypothetical protein